MAFVKLLYQSFILISILSFVYSKYLTKPNSFYSEELVSSLLCGEDSFKCFKNAKRCLHFEWMCDGEDDCEDGFDELLCINSIMTCSDDEYECEVGTHVQDENIVVRSNLAHKSKSLNWLSKCIPITNICNGIKECPQGDDELGCENVTCSTNQFHCQSHTNTSICIPESWVCDGKNDCVDGSDEVKCSSCEENHKSCVLKCSEDEFRCNDGQNCLPTSLKCNGIKECSDDSDEEGCLETCNNSTHHICDVCLDTKYVCDGTPNCKDSSDEMNCPGMNNNDEDYVICRKNQFKCQDGKQCIKKSWECDGIYDCDDRSDEHKCDRINGMGTITAEKKECKDGIELACKADYYDKIWACLSYKDICPEVDDSFGPFGRMFIRNVYDCVNCSKDNFFCERNSPGCKCRSTESDTTICHCKDGYSLKNGTCYDINECHQKDNPCDHICLNLPGTFKCACHPGYQLSDDHNNKYGVPAKCRFIDGNYLVLTSDQHEVRKYDVQTKKINVLASGLQTIGTTDFWFDKNAIVWTDPVEKRMLICYLNDSFFNVSNFNGCIYQTNETLVEENVGEFGGIALDWVHGLVYWIDKKRKTINVVEIETRRSIALIKNLLDPVAIAVDPHAGLIFWSDWGSQITIERAGLDGRNRQFVITDHLNLAPNALAVDIFHRKLYWGEKKKKQLGSCDYYGRNIETYEQDHYFGVKNYGLAVFEDTMYTAAVLGGGNFVWKTTSDIKQMKNLNLKIPFYMPPTFTSIHVYHREAQPIFPNKCYNSICINQSEVCLPKARVTAGSLEEEKMATGLPYSCIKLDDHFPTFDKIKAKVTYKKKKTNSEDIAVGLTIFGIFVIIVVVIIIVNASKGNKTSDTENKYKPPSFSTLLTNDANNIIHSTQQLNE